MHTSISVPSHSSKVDFYKTFFQFNYFSTNKNCSLLGTWIQFMLICFSSYFYSDIVINFLKIQFFFSWYWLYESFFCSLCYLQYIFVFRASPNPTNDVLHKNLSWIFNQYKVGSIILTYFIIFVQVSSLKRFSIWRKHALVCLLCRPSARCGKFQYVQYIYDVWTWGLLISS